MNNSLLTILDKLLTQDEVKNSDIKAHLNNPNIKILIDSLVIVKKSKGRGCVWSTRNKDEIKKLKDHFFPDEALNDGTRKDSIKAFRDSKAKSRKSYKMAFVRTKAPFSVNGMELFAAPCLGFSMESFKAQKVCFIENLENFHGNKFFEDGYVLLMPFGRLGKDLMEIIEAKEVLHFGDCDIEGLKEFARIKEVFPQAKMHIPENYYMDAIKYGKSIGRNQKPSEKLLELIKNDTKAKELFDFIQEKDLFLEQEFYND